MKIFRTQENNINDNLKVIALFFSIIIILSIGSTVQAKKPIEDQGQLPPSWDLVNQVRDIDQSSVVYTLDQKVIDDFNNHGIESEDKFSVSGSSRSAGVTGTISRLGLYTMRAAGNQCLSPVGAGGLGYTQCFSNTQNFEVWTRSDGFYELCRPNTVALVGNAIVGQCVKRNGSSGTVPHITTLNLVIGGNLASPSSDRPIAWVPGAAAGTGSIGFPGSSRVFTRKSAGTIQLNTSAGTPDQIWFPGAPL